jgi:hypothetical protein
VQGISVQVIVWRNVSGKREGRDGRVGGTNATLRAAGGFSISHCLVWVDRLSVWFWDLRSVGVIACEVVLSTEEGRLATE